MAEIMGGGLNEFPFFRFAEEHMGNMFQQRLSAADLPEALRDPDGWPEELRREYGSDKGIAAAREHRQRTADAMRVLRAASMTSRRTSCSSGARSSWRTSAPRRCRRSASTATTR